MCISLSRAGILSGLNSCMFYTSCHISVSSYVYHLCCVCKMLFPWRHPPPLTLNMVPPLLQYEDIPFSNECSEVSHSIQCPGLGLYVNHHLLQKAFPLKLIWVPIYRSGFESLAENSSAGPNNHKGKWVLSSETLVSYSWVLHSRNDIDSSRDWCSITDGINIGRILKYLPLRKFVSKNTSLKGKTLKYYNFQYFIPVCLS